LLRTTVAKQAAAPSTVVLKKKIPNIKENFVGKNLLYTGGSVTDSMAGTSTVLEDEAIEVSF
jgi:hypothetical protein